MYLFAHLFTGILIGLGVFHLCRERRVFPVCIAGALLPDLLDKPLKFLVPGIFGSTRTLGHTLLFVTVLVLAAIILWYRYRALLGIVFALSVLFHQLTDLMWTLPVTWFFPLHGMFPFATVSDNAWRFIVLELTNPAEWAFMLVSGILVITGLAGSRVFRLSFLSQCRTDRLLFIIACLLGIAGAFLIIAGMNLAFTIPVSSREPDKTLMAGLVAWCGAFVLVKLPGMKRPAA